MVFHALQSTTTSRLPVGGVAYTRTADQAELTVLHRPEDDGARRATGCRFCASRESLEPTGTFAVVAV
ncbi:MAG TPA: hypothetical protein VGD78_06770 [Chthoniobacterales bacterium]